MPVRFGYNPQTAANNTFQKEGFEEKAQENALREFTTYASLLKANKVEVVIAEDTEVPYTPDSIFPNNWFSTHEDGTLVLYPMFAVNRRNERKSEFLESIRRNFEVKKLIDLTWWESENQFLEGTGSMIFDRENKIAYAGRSPRTCEPVIADFCKQMGYTAVIFDAYDQNGALIYHTNVMMSVEICFIQANVRNLSFYFNDIQVVSQIRCGEDGAKFVQKEGDVRVTRGVVADEEALYAGIEGSAGGLEGCGMEGLLCHFRHRGRESRLMVEQIDTFDPICQLRERSCIAAIGITAWFIGRSHHSGIGYNLSVFRNPVGPILYVVHLTYWYAICVEHISSDVGQRWFLFKQESAAGLSMS